MAIRLKPDDPFYLNNYGNFLFTLKRFDEAEHYIRKALLIKPEFAEALNNQGSILANQAKQILERSSGNNEITVCITNPIVSEKLDSALMYFTRAKHTDPTLPDPWYYSYLTYQLRRDSLNTNTNKIVYDKLKSSRERRMRLLHKYRNYS